MKLDLTIPYTEIKEEMAFCYVAPRCPLNRSKAVTFAMPGYQEVEIPQYKFSVVLLSIAWVQRTLILRAQTSTEYALGQTLSIRPPLILLK